MYSLLKTTVLRLFRAPMDPPAPPSGQHATVEVVRAAPRFLSYRLLGVGCLGLVVAFAAALSFALGFAAPPLWIVSALVALLFGPLVALQYFAVRVDYDLRYYVITDRSVRVREGAWKVTEKTITFANVQNVRVEQGPIERLFGFSNVRVETAGGGMAQAGQHAVAVSHGVVLAGIENASALRDSILAHVRLRTDGGLGDTDDRASAATSLASAGWPEERVAALRELADSAAALRRVAQSTPPAPGLG